MELALRLTTSGGSVFRLVALLVVSGLTSGVCEAGHPQFWVRQLAPGVFYGPAPSGEGDYRQLQRLGIRSVIDMRSFRVLAIAKERRHLQRMGIAYEQIPIGLDPENDCQLESLLRRLASERCCPVFFHCSLGRDRTGLIVALYQVRYLGFPPLVALEQMKRRQFNPRLTGLTEAFRRLVSQQPANGADAQSCSLHLDSIYDAGIRADARL